MAFKIKDNLDLYGNQLLNFALQSDSGFPQSPQVGHIFNYTGTGVMANHAVMCVDETTKAFKALAFVDEIATNTAFAELADRVLTIEKALGEDTANVIDTWEEIQNFLKDINANDANLMTMLNSKANAGVTGGSGFIAVPYTNNQEAYLIYKGGMKWELSNEGWSGTRTIIHSGNIGEYALFKKDATLLTNANSLDNCLQGLYGYKDGNNPLSSVGHNAAVMAFMGSQATAAHQLAFDGNDNAISYRRRNTSGTWQSWKTIAFTDSDFKLGLGHSITDSNDRSVFSISSDNQINIGYGTAGANFNTNIHGASIILKYGTSRSWGMVMNTSGNVTIGGSDLAEDSARLYIDNNISNSTALGLHVSGVSSNAQALGSRAGWTACIGRPAYGLLIGSNTTTGASLLQVGRLDKEEARQMALQPFGGNVGIGTTDPQYKLDVNGDIRIKPLYSSLVFEQAAYLKSFGSKRFLIHNENGLFLGLETTEQSTEIYGKTINLQAATTINGDLHVTGNIIADKEVSAGGAGQEGESGDGGAEVIDKELAKGQSSYTIPNTIGRSAVAVSLYEWNANNGSWDMCLADISVKDATITVTFGSATSVNHKLVAVG